MYDREKWNELERINNILVKTLKKNMLFSDLVELDKKHTGILIKFWRTNGNQPSFVEWIDTMQKKEAKGTPKKETPKKIEERSSVVEVKEGKKLKGNVNKEAPTPKPDIIPAPSQPKEETDVERIERKLKEIQEKYS